MSRIVDPEGWASRRSRRVALWGRHFEQVSLRRILEDLVHKGQLVEFDISIPNSDSDCEGKDARVVALINGELAVRHFGVTISLSSRRESELKHPDVPQFYFPIGTKDSTIQRRVMSLFD